MSLPPLPGIPRVQQTKAGAPVEGPLVVPVQCDFSANSGYSIDLSDLFNRKYISQLPMLFIDNSGNTSSVTVTVVDTQQKIVCPPQSQGYFAIFQGYNFKFTAQSSGAFVVPMEFMNFPVAPAVWSINGLPLVNTSGAVVTADTILDGAVVSGVLQTAVTGNLAYTDASGTITEGDTAQTISNANANRKAMQLQNISTGVMYYNFGAAAGNGIGFLLAANGGYYENAPGLCTNQSISIWGATTGQAFTFKTA